MSWQRGSGSSKMTQLIEKCMTRVMPQILNAFKAGICREFGHQYVTHKKEELKLKRALETLYQTSVVQQRQVTDSGLTMGPWQAGNP
ncbi:hypothetical protein N0V85_009387 [Neurospora sp. IMI 360204]|nr:hypothetical protein N0V85_009387 [Neurospora sp. IMI 360204]